MFCQTYGEANNSTRFLHSEYAACVVVVEKYRRYSCYFPENSLSPIKSVLHKDYSVCVYFTEQSGASERDWFSDRRAFSVEMALKRINLVWVWYHFAANPNRLLPATLYALSLFSFNVCVRKHPAVLFANVNKSLHAVAVSVFEINIIPKLLTVKCIFGLHSFES